MSDARSAFLISVEGIRGAVQIEGISCGAMEAREPPGIALLRRGVLVGALTAFEQFVRTRTKELLDILASWPSPFQALPARFRDAAILHSLPHVEKYARMLKSNNEDYEAFIVKELSDIVNVDENPYSFTRFIAGDHTGNLNADATARILKTIQILNCWPDFRIFSSRIGFGVPNVKELLEDIARKRHRSAHVASYTPASSDISDLDHALICLGVCFDTAATKSVIHALHFPDDWRDKAVEWLQDLDIFFIDQEKNDYRLLREGAARALRRSSDLDDLFWRTPAPKRAKPQIIIQRDSAKRPVGWQLKTDI